jgi:HSP20 family molecular chaperone IbpA
MLMRTDPFRGAETFAVELDLPGVDPESIDLGVSSATC